MTKCISKKFLIQIQQAALFEGHKNIFNQETIGVLTFKKTDEVIETKKDQH